MSEITELNGFGSQDWPNRANNTDPVINPHPPFLPHPAGQCVPSQPLLSLLKPPSTTTAGREAASMPSRNG